MNRWNEKKEVSKRTKSNKTNELQRAEKIRLSKKKDNRCQRTNTFESSRDDANKLQKREGRVKDIV